MSVSNRNSSPNEDVDQISEKTPRLTHPQIIYSSAGPGPGKSLKALAELKDAHDRAQLQQESEADVAEEASEEVITDVVGREVGPLDVEVFLRDLRVEIPPAAKLELVADRSTPIRQLVTGDRGVVYAQFLRQGLTFPFFPLFKELMGHFQVHPGQCHFNVVCIIQAFMARCRFHKITPSFELLRSLYRFKLAGDRFTLSVRHNLEKPYRFTNSTRGWDLDRFTFDRKVYVVPDWNEDFEGEGDLDFAIPVDLTEHIKTLGNERWHLNNFRGSHGKGYQVPKENYLYLEKSSDAPERVGKWKPDMPDLPQYPIPVEKEKTSKKKRSTGPPVKEEGASGAGTTTPEGPSKKGKVLKKIYASKKQVVKKATVSKSKKVSKSSGMEPVKEEGEDASSGPVTHTPGEDLGDVPEQPLKRRRLVKKSGVVSDVPNPLIPTSPSRDSTEVLASTNLDSPLKGIGPDPVYDDTEVFDSLYSLHAFEAAIEASLVDIGLEFADSDVEEELVQPQNSRMQSPAKEGQPPLKRPRTDDGNTILETTQVEESQENAVVLPSPTLDATNISNLQHPSHEKDEGKAPERPLDILPRGNEGSDP